LRTSKRSRPAPDYAALAGGRPVRPPTTRPTPLQRRTNSCPRRAPASARHHQSSTRPARSLSPTPVVRDAAPLIHPGAYFWILTSDRRATGRQQTTWGTHHADYAGPHTLDLDTRSAHPPTPTDPGPPGSEHPGNHCRGKTTPPVGPKLHSCRRAVSHPQQLAGTLPDAWTFTPTI
jgi:hypothetical protein